MRERQITAIKNIITNSSLNEEDKKELLERILVLDNESLTIFWQILIGNPQNIELINERFKAKKTAFQNKDSNKWSEILKQEQEELRKIITQ